ncbi:hypothetical protein GRS96_12515 [Rathayibacter sp. VKM Ac-2803]|uniref:helix-turn-helix domain-containing protein n=1 Tax=Rathayibacter sp. VKM Ac-2803 TaxID=2609256 RepID=UPI00135BACA1|nr:helix-turn-helix domain-containing protein [Rathayibacter sp. VKM Ac-2803]MWV50092.1 hypothetical protein [Rathayibacter sp. VKM Ac-2803]
MSLPTSTGTDSPKDPTGFAQIPRWLQQDSSIPGYTKLVYLALSSRVDKYGTAFPSHATIAAEASCSIASVKRALVELREIGVVEWTNAARGNGGQSANEYTVKNHARRPKRSAEPVDNSAGGSSGRATPQLSLSEGVAQGERPLNESHLTRPNLTSQSHTEAHQGHAPASTDGEIHLPASPTPLQVFGGRHEVNVVDFLSSVGHVFADCDLNDEQFATLCHEIVAKSKLPVANPTAYAIAAVRRDGFEWQQRAFELTGELLAEKLLLEGNAF